MIEALQKVTMTRSKLKRLSYYKINTRITTKSSGISGLTYLKNQNKVIFAVLW